MEKNKGPAPVMDTMVKVDTNLVNAKQQLAGFQQAYGLSDSHSESLVWK